MATDLFERMTIRKRLLVLLLPALGALLALWAWSAYLSVLHFADIAYDRALYDSARTLATQVKVQDGKPILDLSEDEREMLEVDPQDDVYFEVFAADGSRLGGTAELPAPAPKSSPGDFGYLYDGQFLNESLRLVQYVPSAAEPLQYVVRVGETRRKRTRLATEATLAMAPMQIVFIGTSVLARLARRRLGTPAARGVAGRDRAARSRRPRAAVAARATERAAQPGQGDQRAHGPLTRRARCGAPLPRRRDSPAAHTAHGAAHADGACAARSRFRFAERKRPSHGGRLRARSLGSRTSCST